MKNNIYAMLCRAFLLFCIVIFLGSCKLFRRKENSNSSSQYSTTSNTTARKTYNTKTINEIVSLARSYTGVPYRSGGTDGNGMDCSGLLYCVYGKYGFKIPRISWQQSEVGKKVEIEDLRPGDWVFFVTNKGNVANINHAGLVTELRSNKEIMFIHASSSKGIREDNLYSTYWISCFAKAIRPF